MITPEFIGQIYRNTLNGDVWRANSLTPGDWTKIAGTAVAGANVDGVGNPTGVVTPLYVGQYYRDTATGNIWKSTGTTNADWTLTVQDMQWQWTPTNLKLDEELGFAAYVDITTLVSFSYTGATSVGGFNFSNCSNLLSASFPNLTFVDGTNGFFSISGCVLMTSFSAPLLVTFGYTLEINYNDSLTSVDISSFLPTNGKTLSFNNNALTLASVDHILSRCVANPAYVSGLVKVNGGTNAPPPTGPGTNHDILVARGVTITHN